MDIPGKNPAADQDHDRVEVVEPPHMSPALAWILSLVVPGVGQAYCGKTSRGAWISFIFAVALFGVFFLSPSSEKALQTIWWVSARAVVVLWAFAPLDAYFTAREIILGEDWPAFENPRVAAMLNLLTMGGGYLCLGEREKGMTAFMLLGLLSRSALTSAGVLFEVGLMMIAMDAYRIAAEREGEFFDPLGIGRLGLVSLTLREALQETPAVTRRPILELGGSVSVLGPAIPVGLVCLLGVFYLHTISLSVEAPDYDMIDQSRAKVAERKGEWVYQNPRYGVEAHVPVYWRLENPKKEVLFSAEGMNGRCGVALILEATLPFASLESKAGTLAQQVLFENKQTRFLRNRPEKLGNLHGYEVAFASTVQGDEWFQSHVMALQGLTLYRLVTTASGDRQRPCWSETQKIREEIVITR